VVRKSIWRWFAALFVLLTFAGCSISNSDGLPFFGLIGLAVFIYLFRDTESEVNYEDCDCERCTRVRRAKQARLGAVADTSIRVRNQGMGLMARLLGVDIVNGDQPMLEARSLGYTLRVRDCGSEYDLFTVVQLDVPSDCEEFPVFLMRNSLVAPLDEAEWEVVKFHDDKRFETFFLLEVQRPKAGIEERGLDGSIGRVQSMFTPEFRSYLKFGTSERRWTLGARGHCVEAHLNRRWKRDEYEYRSLIAEALRILVTLATGRPVSNELYESWRPTGHWLVSEILQGLVTGRGYSEVSLPRRAEEIAFHQQWMAKGFQDAVTVPDGRYASLSSSMNGVRDVSDFEITFCDRDLQRDLVQKRVTLDGGGTLVVTVLVVRLPDGAPNLQRFRFGPKRRDLMGSRSDSAFDIFALQTCVESDGFPEADSGCPPMEPATECSVFTVGLWDYLASEPVVSRGWFVEASPRRMEIHRGCAIDVEVAAYTEFVRGATDLAVAIASKGRVTSQGASFSGFNASPAASSAETNPAEKFSRKGLKQAGAEGVPPSADPVVSVPKLDVVPMRMDFASFVEALGKRYPGQMALLQQGLSALHRQEHLKKLYAEYCRSGVVPPL
jgi:hypothetical protein